MATVGQGSAAARSSGVGGADRLARPGEGRVGGIDHHVAEQAHQALVGDVEPGQLGVEGRLEQVADLSLGHRHQDLQRQLRHLGTGLLLQQQVADLRAVAVGDQQPVVAAEGGQLPRREPQVGELLGGASFLSLADQGVSPQGDQQQRALGVHRISCVPVKSCGRRSRSSAARVGVPWSR